MALPLSSVEVAHLEAAQRILLSSLAYDATEHWWAAASSALCTLFSGEYIYSYINCPGDPRFYVERLDPPESPDARVHSGSVALAPASLHEPVASHDAHVRLPGMPEVTPLPRFSPNHSLRARPRPGDSITVYHDDAGSPSGDLVLASIGLYHFPSQAPDTVAHSSGILRLLHPAFHSGVRAAARLHVARHALASALDGIGEAVLLAGPQGEPFHVTSTLTTLLETDPERESVRERLRELARRVVRLAWARPISNFAQAEESALPRGWQIEEIISTAANTYRARAVSLNEALLGHQAVAVSVEQLSPEPGLGTDATSLSEGDLYDAYGLTPQEARVALLLSDRKRNAEIADALCVSPHTARHHTERVLEKLDIHSRDDVRDTLKQLFSTKK